MSVQLQSDMFLAVCALTVVLALAFSLAGFNQFLLDWTTQTILIAVLVLSFILDKCLEHKVNLWYESSKEKFVNHKAFTIITIP